MSDITLTANTCCFTGHRPKSLPWGYDETSAQCNDFKSVLENTIRQAIDNGYTHFIVGLAEGFDTYALEILISLRDKEQKQITIEGAIPCVGQESVWDTPNQDRYKMLKSKLDFQTIISESYSKTCMHKRNDYMLACSSLVIACYHGITGGTSSTLKKAQKQGKQIIVINPNTLNITRSI